MTPDFAEPHATPVILRGLRAAALARWGPLGLAAIGALLPPEIRRAAVDVEPPRRAWVPERHVIAFAQAAMNGPCQGRAGDFSAYVGDMVALGFGRVRRLFLMVVSPIMLLERSPDLWHLEHSHGQLSSYRDGPQTGVMILRDHPYTQTPAARLAIAEGFRHGMSLTRTRGPVAIEHALRADGALEVRLSWT